jgi:hypothetical protein
MGFPAIERDVQGEKSKQHTSQFSAKKMKTLKNTEKVCWVWRGGGRKLFGDFFVFAG